MKHRTKLITGSGAAATIAAIVIASFEFAGPTPPTTAYLDSVGTPTICAGKTAGVKLGDTATVAQCKAWLATRAAKDIATVRRCITAPTTLGQQVAFADAVHNLGAGVVCGSTLQKLANRGDMDRACLQLVDAVGSDGLPTGWTKAGGKVSMGLLNRREYEVILCLKGLP